MRNKFRMSVCACVVAGTVFTACAIASTDGIKYNQRKGVYLSGNLGVGLGTPTTSPPGSSDTTNSGLYGFGGGAALGYQFNPYVGLEAEIIGLTNGTSNAEAYGVAVKGILPFSSRGLFFAKLGVAYAAGSVDIQIVSDNPITINYSAASPLFGLGIGLALTQHTDLMLEYNAFMLNANSASGGATGSSGAIASGLVGVLAIGVTYHFS